MKRMNLENLPYWQENPAWLNEDTEGYRITDRDIYFGDDYKELYHFRIEKSRFHDGFRGRHLVKVQFFNCDFSNMQFESATLLKVEFNQCNLTGTEFSNMNMKSVMFNECKMMFNNFTECKFENIVFNDIMFKQLFLNQTKMKSLEFNRCQIDDFEVFDTPLADVDLSGIDLGKITIQEEDLRGSIISSGQAADFVKLFGLRVKRE
ncbi:MAG TPA: pentapeptide repeat-containing protein [Candidatus Salinicoccus stercoripullorum]|uniref:Pentapeptide repeat-containing protein n=1 Tax=Candidatus Salinicoccus stercoripullorum TaxID=2838756 RepID=A0A9D1QID2_9STAP|nr:pentapeptide repeat-containing protein [Candidatus Salinicoccus stercoripullorum]